MLASIGVHFSAALRGSTASEEGEPCLHDLAIGAGKNPTFSTNTFWGTALLHSGLEVTSHRGRCFCGTMSCHVLWKGKKKVDKWDRRRP